MKKLVGKYMLGFRNIRLYLDTESADGSVELLPDDKGSTIVTVGIDCCFAESVGVLLHEIYEASLIDMNTRHKQSPRFSSESSDFIFIVSHNDLGEVHERVGIFMAVAYEEFSELYEKLHKKMKHK